MIPGNYLIHRPRRVVVLIPTNTPDVDDPRSFSNRSYARFLTGMQKARELRKELGRANVLVVAFGGWTLHNRLPLVVHHVHEAIKQNLLELPELDLMVAHGPNTVTDIYEVRAWLESNAPGFQEAFLVTSKGHARRTVAEGELHDFFAVVNHIESKEIREITEDNAWTERALNTPAYQFSNGGRASDVARFGERDALAWAEKMKQWAQANPNLWIQYQIDVWQMIGELEAANVAVRSDAPGGWVLRLN